MSTNEIPTELAEIIATHRGLFGGYTMTAPTPEPAPATPAEPAAPVAPPAAPAAPQAPAPAEPTTWDGKVETLPQGAQDLIKQLRTENAAKRTAAKAADDDANAKIAAALKALGIDTTTEDPIEAAKQAKAERDTQASTARAAKVELAIYKSAAKAGADPDALLDSNTFLASIKELDPSDAKAVEAAIKAALDTNPKLKATQVVTKSGPEINGGAGGQGKPKSLEEAVAAKLAH